MTTPGRVFYPATGTTKTDVIDYYLAVAGVMLPHLVGRPATRKRWTDGVGGPEFFAKEIEQGTAAWMHRVQIVHGSGPKFYPIIDSPAGLGWLGQVGALELHVPQWRIPPATGALRGHVDIDGTAPGPGGVRPGPRPWRRPRRMRTGRAVPAGTPRHGLGERTVPVTSGSKGLHLYVPMDAEITSGQASEWARLVAEQVEKAMPELVVSRMAKTLRRNKVLIDWSQNNGKKTTIAPYSMRGREHLTLAAPRTWGEIAGPDLAHLDYREVLDRVDSGLDPMSALADTETSALASVVGADQPAPTPTSRATARSSTRPAASRPSSRLKAAQKPRRRAVTAASASELPADLLGPVDLALAKAVEDVPGPHALPGGSRYELKWDGYRGAIVRRPQDARLWSRQRNDMTTQFPELIAAAETLPPGTVIDGEVVNWNGARLDFDLL